MVKPWGTTRQRPYSLPLRWPESTFPRSSSFVRAASPDGSSWEIDDALRRDIHVVERVDILALVCMRRFERGYGHNRQRHDHMLSDTSRFGTEEKKVRKS